ncbi:unnamed protein product [Schistosoma curassoni]|uniref:Secreted protein n=1 Tax=Schistosoma curassoni TaxID=6186 RepID=A0A183KNR5_9TREM|nr:unnamed protein product [Schistosoma curassoni]
MFAVTSMSDLSASAGILSGRAALPHLICLAAMLISPTVGGVTSISRPVRAASTPGGSNGAGLLESSSKCSTHILVVLEPQ